MAEVEETQSALIDDAEHARLALSPIRKRLLAALRQQRRTVYLSGPTRPDGRPLSDALGLHALWDAKPDSPSLVELPTQSQNMSASYRTGFQLGLHVPGWGGGMLVVADIPADAKQPARGSLLITTFGMEEKAASEFAQRWTQWWEGRHPPASA